MSDFQWGMMAGCLLSMLVGLVWMGICNAATPKNNYPKDRDPADWWKDT